MNLRFIRIPTVLLPLTIACYAAPADQLPDKQILGAADATEQVGPELRSTAEVDGDGVFLDQLLSTIVDPPRLRLCDAPVFGKSLVLKRAELAQFARAAGHSQALTNWSGAPAIRITRRARPFSEKDALQLLRTVLQQDYVKDLGELELRLSRSWNTIQVPDEAFTIKIVDLPTTGVSPVFIVRFEMVMQNGEHLGPWQAPLQAKVWRDVWTVRSAVKRGELVRAADLVLERRDMLVCREPMADLPADDGTLEFGESLAAGTPVWARSVRPRAIIHRGQSLAAVLQDGALMIQLKVEALEDGAAGQVIRVRNPLSRRDLHAKVLDEQNVIVAL